MKIYRAILSDHGIIHLKTDSRFMYTYTCEMVKINRFPVLIQTENLYESGIADEILSIRTYYEQQWLERGIPTKYLRFVCEPRDQLIEPEIEIEHDTYRSYNRSRR
jgi:tRNA (guanine-N7-)-methyltransferase